MPSPVVPPRTQISTPAGAACLAVQARCHLLLLMLATAGLLLCSAPSRAEMRLGINGHPLVSYPGVGIARQLDYIVDLGLQSYRVDVPSIAAARRLRQLVDAARSHKIDILPVITPAALDLDRTSAEQLEKMAFDLAIAMIAPFKGEIPVWELGNELENYAILKPCETRDDGTVYDCSYGPAGGTSVLDYHGERWSKVSAVLKGLSRGARQADPAALRAIGTAGWGHTAAFERMRADGIEWDISVWHMYGEDPRPAFEKLAAYGKPIWVTEFNAPYGSGKGDSYQARELVGTIARLRDLAARYRVTAAHIYELIDQSYWGDSFEAKMGLVRLERRGDGRWAPGTPKPAYSAVRRLTGAPGVSVFAEPKPITARRDCELQRIEPVGQTSAVDVVSYAYCLVLGRAADGAGSAAYAKRMARGLDAAGFVLELLASDELRERFTLDLHSDESFIAGMHELLLGQPPSAEVAKAALSALARSAPNGRTGHLARLVGSKEFRTRHAILFRGIEAEQSRAGSAPSAPAVPEIRRRCTPDAATRTPSLPNAAHRQVRYAFCVVLGRWPDAHGLRAWSHAVENGLDLEELLLRLCDSGEFNGRYRTEALTNADFVTLGFRLLLGREPDAAGAMAYEQALSQGRLGRRALLEELIGSQEFKQRHEAILKTADAGLVTPRSATLDQRAR